MNFLVGLLVIAGGVVSIYFSDQIAKFGTIQWAERNIGGTRSFYVLIGFITVVAGIMILFGLVDLSADPVAIQY